MPKGKPKTKDESMTDETTPVESGYLTSNGRQIWWELRVNEDGTREYWVKAEPYQELRRILSWDTDVQPYLDGKTGGVQYP